MSCVSHLEIIRNEEKNKKNRKMPNYMTKYEKARILSVRARQISEGSVINVELDSSYIEPYLIALKELNENKLDLTIRRYYPDGSYEDWDVNELIYEK